VPFEPRIRRTCLQNALASVYCHTALLSLAMDGIVSSLIFILTGLRRHGTVLPAARLSCTLAREWQ